MAPTPGGPRHVTETCPRSLRAQEGRDARHATRADFKHGRSDVHDGVRQKHEWTQTSLTFCRGPYCRNLLVTCFRKRALWGYQCYLQRGCLHDADADEGTAGGGASRPEEHRTNLLSGSAQCVEAARAPWAGRDPDSAPSPVPGQPFVLRMSRLLPRPFGIVYV